MTLLFDVQVEFLHFKALHSSFKWLVMTQEAVLGKKRCFTTLKSFLPWRNQTRKYFSGPFVSSLKVDLPDILKWSLCFPATLLYAWIIIYISFVLCFYWGKLNGNIEFVVFKFLPLLFLPYLNCCYDDFNKDRFSLIAKLDIYCLNNNFYTIFPFTCELCCHCCVFHLPHVWNWEQTKPKHEKRIFFLCLHMFSIKSVSFNES